MLDAIDLSRKVSKQDYKSAKDDIERRLVMLQRELLQHRVPVIVVYEGWDAAGKGTLINSLILPLDPRGFSVYSALPPNEEESRRPFLWRFWTRTPAGGRIAIFDRSWYRHVLHDRVEGLVDGTRLRYAYEDIRSFERQLADNGTVIVKLFLHISRKEQKRRFDKLRKSPATAWRVTRDDRRRHRQYDEYLAASDAMLAETGADYAPWTIIEAHDRHFAELKMFNTVLLALESALQRPRPAAQPATRKPPTGLPAGLSTSILQKADLARSLTRERYRQRLKQMQAKLRELEHTIYTHRIPVIIVYEGWDAAGKGGNLRRLTQNLDPRGYDVVPVAAPNDIEKAHHYLWRFWNEVPKAGHITIFDRSWYGRVLVERVEGFCSEGEWRRAYREINEMERHFVRSGAVVQKFWIHIDKAEQLRRFREREKTTHKQWKITDEDWRNRKKWKPYEAAVEEMLFRTSSPAAPWTVVESNCKWYARIKVLSTVIRAIEKRVKKG